MRESGILIFVTVGTHNQSFERLLKEIDRLIDEGKIRDKVLAQIGNTDYKPRNYKWFGFSDQGKFEDLCKKSDIVVTHGGAGSITTSLLLQKPTIVVPRLKEFGEHANNHQLQITKELEKEGRIIAVYDMDDLFTAIKRARKARVKKIKKEQKAIRIIDKKLKLWFKSE